MSDERTKILGIRKADWPATDTPTASEQASASVGPMETWARDAVMWCKWGDHAYIPMDIEMTEDYPKAREIDAIIAAQAQEIADLKDAVTHLRRVAGIADDTLPLCSHQQEIADLKARLNAAIEDSQIAEAGRLEALAEIDRLRETAENTP